MKKNGVWVAGFLTLNLLAAPAYAGCVGTVIMGECKGTEIDGVGDSVDSGDSGYESSSGTRYQYDLNDPGDSMDYGYDFDAQRRDQMSADPNRDLDQDTGQNGGGIYND